MSKKKSFCPGKSMLGDILRKFSKDQEFDKNLKLFAFLKKIIKILILIILIKKKKIFLKISLLT